MCDQNICGIKREVCVKCGTKTEFFLTESVICVYHEGRKTYIVTTDRELKTYSSYRSVKAMLTEDYFCETDKGCLVNLNFVTSYSRQCIICDYDDCAHHLYVSRRKYKEFCRKMNEIKGI